MKTVLDLLKSSNNIEVPCITGDNEEVEELEMECECGCRLYYQLVSSDGRKRLECSTCGSCWDFNE